MTCNDCPYWYATDDNDFAHCQCQPDAIAPCETFDDDEPYSVTITFTI